MALGLACPSVARAQAPVPSPPPPVEPPRLLAPPEPVDVPAGSPARAFVVLEIEIDVAGRVNSNVVVADSSGDPAIDAAAVAAAGAMRFSPARREGEPVAARIRYRFSLRRPVSAAAPTEGELIGRVLDARTRRAVAGARVVIDGGASATTGPDGGFVLRAPPGLQHLRVTHAAHRPVVVDETFRAAEAVTVTYRLLARAEAAYETIVAGAGVRQELGRETLVEEEIRTLPGTMGDPFRVIESLPGVAPTIAGLPYYFVRGAPPGDTGYFLDGVRLPQLFHFALGPAVVPPEMIQRLDFFPGGFPVRYGRYVGGIVSALTAPPDAGRTRAQADVRLYDSGAFVEAPLAGGRATVFAGGRYSYTAGILSLLAPGLDVAYWDYQLRGDLALRGGARLTLLAFGSFDRLSAVVNPDVTPPTTFDLQVEFHRIDLRYDRPLPRGGRLRIAYLLGRDLTLVTRLGTISELIAGPRFEWELPIGTGARIRLGADAISHLFELLPGGEGRTAEEIARLLPPRNALEAGVYADVIVYLGPDLLAVPGVRADLYSSEGVARGGVDPRISFRWTLGRRLVLKASAGLFHQPPSFVVPVPGLELTELGAGLQQALQLSQGAEVRLPGDVGLDVQVFAHRYDNLSDLVLNPNRTRSVDAQSGSAGLVRIRGQAYGLEVLLRRALTRRFYGWIAYTLSRSTRDFAIEGRLPSDFDQTHILNLVASYDFGRGWRAGLRFSYTTGRPVTPQLDFGLGVDLPAARNSVRLPDFWRLDARVDKRWRASRHLDLDFYLDFANVTLNREAVDYTCGGSILAPTCSPYLIGPVAYFTLGIQATYDFVPRAERPR